MTNLGFTGVKTIALEFYMDDWCENSSDLTKDKKKDDN